MIDRVNSDVRRPWKSYVAKQVTSKGTVHSLGKVQIITLISVCQAHEPSLCLPLTRSYSESLYKRS